MKDHEIATLVNEITSVAREFHATQQLRERIGRPVVAALKQQQAEISRLRAAIEEAMPFQLTIGAEILGKALGPNIEVNRHGTG